MGRRREIPELQDAQVKMALCIEKGSVARAAAHLGVALAALHLWLQTHPEARAIATLPRRNRRPLPCAPRSF